MEPPGQVNGTIAVPRCGSSAEFPDTTNGLGSSLLLLGLQPQPGVYRSTIPLGPDLPALFRGALK